MADSVSDTDMDDIATVVSVPHTPADELRSDSAYEIRWSAAGSTQSSRTPADTLS